MRLVRIFTQPSGESALEVRQVPMRAGGRPASATFAAGALFFRETPEGHVQGLHNAPRRQLIFLASGLLELESSAMPPDFDVSQWPLAERLDP